MFVAASESAGKCRLLFPHFKSSPVSSTADRLLAVPLICDSLLNEQDLEEESSSDARYVCGIVLTAF